MTHVYAGAVHWPEHRLDETEKENFDSREAVNYKQSRGNVRWGNVINVIKLKDLDCVAFTVCTCIQFTLYKLTRESRVQSSNIATSSSFV